MGISPTPQPSLEPLPVITDFVDEFKCNFDSGLCGMSQDVVENADYILNSGPTLNNMTGPSTDHTTGEGKHDFLSIKTSSLNISKQLSNLKLLIIKLIAWLNVS